MFLVNEPWQILQAWSKAPDYATSDDWYTSELAQQLMLRAKFVVGSLAVVFAVFALGSS